MLPVRSSARTRSRRIQGRIERLGLIGGEECLQVMNQHQVIRRREHPADVRQARREAAGIDHGSGGSFEHAQRGVDGEHQRALFSARNQELVRRIDGALRQTESLPDVAYRKDFVRRNDRPE